MRCREEPNWADLPELPLFTILKKVIPLSGFFQFSAVCRTWRRVALDDPGHTRQRFMTCSEQIPFLMVPVAEANADKNMLYTVSGHKLPNFQLSIPYNIMCCGTSYGWMVVYTEEMVYTEEIEQFEISLYNPFSHNTICNLPLIKIGRPSHIIPQFFLRKVILSNNPSTSPHHFYIAVLHYLGGVVLLKYGQKSWTYIRCLWGDLLFTDIIFYKGLLYAVERNSTLVASLDFLKILNQGINNQSQVICELQASPIKCMYRGVACLVESSRGELWMVRRFFNDVNSTTRFVVLEVILTGGHNGWSIELVELNSLGGDALFVGGNYSSSVRAWDFPGCQPDSIYFTDHFVNFNKPRFSDHPGPCDVGVYNIENGSIKRHHDHLVYTSNDLPLPIWITPTPFGLC